MRLNLSRNVVAVGALCFSVLLWKTITCSLTSREPSGRNQAQAWAHVDSDWDLAGGFEQYCSAGCKMLSESVKVTQGGGKNTSKADFTAFLFLTMPESINMGYYDRATQVAEVVRHGVKTRPADSKIVFLDIGGNLGYFTLLATKAGADAAHYFEPQPICAHVGSSSMVLNGLAGKVSVHNAGVSDTPTSFKLCADACYGGYTYEMKNLLPDTGPPDPNGAKCGMVHTMKVENAISADRASGHAHIKYVVKIDTEGSEIAVLRSILGVLGKPGHTFTDFVIEIAPHAWNLKDLTIKDGLETLAKLLAHGYTAYSLNIGLCAVKEEGVITKITPPTWLNAPLYSIDNMAGFINERAKQKCGFDMWVTNYWKPK